MSNTNDSQNKSIYIEAKVSEKLARDFRIALAIRGESVQDVITRAALEYIKATKLPDDVTIGKL